MYIHANKNKSKNENQAISQRSDKRTLFVK